MALPALAQEAVGNVGLRSVDIPTNGLAPFEAALDRAISIRAGSRAKTATLSALAADVEVSSRRELARTNANSGANAMRQLELDKAQEEFDKAATLFVAAHGDRIEPSEVARIYTTRAKIAQMQRAGSLMKGEFERAMPLHATKQLDPATFPPESVSLFQQVLAEALKTPMVPPASSPLADIAKRTSLRWIVAGEVRGNAPASPRVVLTVVDATGAASSVDFLAPAENLNAAFEAAVGKIFAAAGVPPRAAAIVATSPNGTDGATTITGDPVPDATGTAIAAVTPRPVPSQALPRPTPTPSRSRAAAGAKPLERRWYFLVGAALLALSGGVVLAASSGGEKKSTQDPPPDEGITLVIERP